MIGYKLKQLREEYEITKQRLAAYMKVSEEDVGAWERNESEPNLKQIQTLAELFEVSLDELFQVETSASKRQEDSSSNKERASNKGKTKKKTKKKNKTKYKVKNGEKVVKKGNNLPVILFIILLLVAIGVGGGYLYWKYGDKYFIGRNADYKVEDMVGTFTAATKQSDTIPKLVLKNDNTFELLTDSCNAESTIKGEWTLDENVLELKDYGGNKYNFQINSLQKLKYISASLGCAPLKNDLFNRGDAMQEDSDTDNEKEDSEQEVASTVTTGQWSGSNSTLIVSDVFDQTVTFTLTSMDPNTASNIATLSAIVGSVNKNTVSFHFTDDGFGSAGNGTIVFDETTAVFSITKTISDPNAPWGILDSGTLYK